jgi:DNA-directed RNA polymerase subunit beta
MRGVVLSNNLFSRTIKDRRSKVKEKSVIEELDTEYNQYFEELKSKLIDKLTVLVSNRTSQGVYNNFGDMVVPQKNKIHSKNTQQP